MVFLLFSGEGMPVTDGMGPQWVESRRNAKGLNPGRNYTRFLFRMVVESRCIRKKGKSSQILDISNE